MSNELEKKEGAVTVERETTGADMLKQILSDGKITRSKNPEHKALEEVYGREMIAAFLQQAMQGQLVIERNTAAAIHACIGAIDRVMSAQLNEILHHPDFQRLEASWRGLHYLVMNSETGTELQIRVLNASKEDLLDNFQNALEFDQSALFQKVYEAGFGQAGAAPYGALIGDYEFSHHDQDVKLLKSIAQVASAGHAPFVAAAAPQMFEWESFTELSDQRSLAEIFDKPQYTKYSSFRDSEDSRYVGLTLPHVLMRLPYDEQNTSIKSFRFREAVDGKDHTKFLWGNAAYAFGTRLTDSFARYKWCANIRGHNSGGKVEGLETHTFKTDEGDIALKCPTEIAITDRREKEFSDLGFIPLVHYQDTDYAVFFGAQSVQKPKSYFGKDKDAAEANARLSARMPYIFAVSRFAHYLKAIMRDYIGSTEERAGIERILNDWISDYVLSNPDNAGEELKAQKPLREASIQVEEVPGQPGSYRAIAHLRPHLQLEELTASLRLVATLPERRGGQ